MSDNIGLIHHGKLIQWDSAYNIYHKPTNRFVANFIGQGEFISGKYLGDNKISTRLGIIEGDVSSDFATGSLVDFLIRPDDVIHDDSSDIKLEIVERLFRGVDFIYTLKIEGGGTLLCIAPSHHNHQLKEKIGIKFDLSHIVMFEKESGLSD